MNLAKKIHRILGLVMLVHVTVFFASGFVLLCFKIDEKTIDSKKLSPARLESILASEELSDPHKAPVLILRKANKISIRMNQKDTPVLKGASRHNFSAFKGNGEAVKKSDFEKWLLGVHRDFGFGKIGKKYMTYVGYLYLVLILTGFLSTSLRVLKSSYNLIRKKQYYLVNSYSAHASLGMLLTPFLLFMGATGSLLYAKNDMFKDFQSETFKSMKTSQASSQKISGVKAFDKAQQAVGDKFLYFMAYPGSEYAGKDHYAVIFKDSMASDSQTLVLVDAYTSEAIIPEMPFLLDLSFKSLAYHRGYFNIIDFKYLWLILVVFSFLLIYSGILVFINRYKLKKGVAI